VAQLTNRAHSSGGGSESKGKRYRRPASARETQRRKQWAAQWAGVGREYKQARLRREAEK